MKNIKLVELNQFYLETLDKEYLETYQKQENGKNQSKLFNKNKGMRRS